MLQGAHRKWNSHVAELKETDKVDGYSLSILLKVTQCYALHPDVLITHRYEQVL